MFWNRPPEIHKITRIRLFYMKYDGKTGYAQVRDKITTKYIAVEVNNTAGRIWRIVKVTKRTFYVDFSVMCTGLNFKTTKFILE
ncbi:unnamed protein product [marine sediment metagenome]|uniref:Uncharacterized protein n=1 Tax=marine sediment metagenome TaxID=412755 RepID=X0RUA3_9ZZZZ